MTSAHPDEFNKEQYLASSHGYQQESGGRLYLNRADDLAGTWVDRAQEESVRAQIASGHNESYDWNAQSLARLIGVGTDAPVVAELTVGIERRAALGRVKTQRQQEMAKELPTEISDKKMAINKKKTKLPVLSKRQVHVKEVAKEIARKDEENLAARERRLRELDAVRWPLANKESVPIASAMSLLEKTPGHRFYVERVLDPYREPLRLSAETRTYLDGNDTPNQHCAPLASLKRWPEAPQVWARGKDVYAVSDGDTLVHRLPGMSQSQSDETVSAFPLSDFRSNTQGFSSAAEVKTCSKSPLRHLALQPSSEYQGLYTTSAYSAPSSSSPFSQSAVNMPPHNRFGAAASSVVSGSLSSLQRTLIQCGALSKADSQAESKELSKLTKVVEGKKSMIRGHASWLQQNGDYYDIARKQRINASDDSRYPKSEVSSISTEIAFANHGRGNKSSDGSSSTSLRELTDEAGRELPKIKDIIRPIARDVENYETQLAQHLVISSPLRNPFRNKRSDHIAGIDQSEPSVKAHKGSVIAKNKDNKLYAKATDTRKLGSLSCVVSLPERDLKGNLNGKVRKESVMKAMTTLTKQNIYSFDTRIVETGALIKALTDVRLPAPGMAAIIELHRRFIDAASTNPNPWLLHKRQVTMVLKEMVPWLDNKVIDRLNISYDPQRSGVTRYVRISAALVAGTRPAMTELMALVNKGKSMSKFSAELFLLRLIFNMYEECDGVLAGERAFGGVNDKGIRLEDIVEALSCCSCSVDEQIRISTLGNKVVQHFFDKLRNADISFDIGSHSQTQSEWKAKHIDDGDDGDEDIDSEEIDDQGGLISPLMRGPLTKDFYGRVTRTATAQFRIRDATHRWGLPLPTSHLNYLREQTKRQLQDQAMMQHEAAYRRQLRQQTHGVGIFTTGAGDSHVIPGKYDHDNESVASGFTAAEGSLFLGGKSVWTETPSHAAHSLSSKNSIGDGKKSISTSVDGASTDKKAKKLSADKFLRHSQLRSIVTYPKIPIDDVCECLNTSHPEVLEEFAAQVHRCRSLIFPYSVSGSVTFEDSVMLNSSYGTNVSSKGGFDPDPSGASMMDFDSYTLNGDGSIASVGEEADHFRLNSDSLR